MKLRKGDGKYLTIKLINPISRKAKEFTCIIKFSTMKPQDIYKYCLRCGGGLKKLDEITFQCEKCKNKMFVNPEPVASVILEKGENQILLAKRAIEPAKDKWDVPGGFIKPGETAEQAGVREIKEELGITINIIDIIGTVAPQDYTYQGIDDRKSTRLNSSHSQISYAVFCLKKK